MPTEWPTRFTSCACATRRRVSGGGCDTRHAGLSQQSGEAGGSLIQEVLGRVGSSPDNDGTGRYCQTVRVRLARQRGVTRVNQRVNPLKRGTGSNLVDGGRAAVGVDLSHGETTPKPASDAGGEATVNVCGVAVGEAVAAKLGVDPADRCMVNVGTVAGLPFPASRLLVGGQAHRRLRTPQRDGGSVVVRARESRVHGEGTQPVRSADAGMPGGRR
jgi:hypothetical protein